MMVRRQKRRKEWGHIVYGVMSVFSLFLILKNSELAIDYITGGMKLCTSTVIPSLFPFMVVSELIVKSGAAEAAGKLIALPSRKLFGIGGEGGSVFLLGVLCGFPIGTRAAISLYKEGRISYDELCRLLCFSNNPSSAFVISAVGGYLFGNRDFGVVLYVCTILSSIIIGVVQNKLLKREAKKSNTANEILITVGERGASVRGIKAFTDAISSSATAMLSVCAFVIFFSVLAGTLGSTLTHFGASQALKALLFSALELTSGVAAASGVEPTLLAILIAAFGVGWSGMSVHFQIISICDGVGIGFGNYFLAKVCQGILNAILICFWFLLFGERVIFDAKSVFAFDYFTNTTSVTQTSVLLFFFVCLVVYLTKRVCNIKKS